MGVDELCIMDMRAVLLSSVRPFPLGGSSADLKKGCSDIDTTGQFYYSL